MVHIRDCIYKNQFSENFISHIVDFIPRPVKIQTLLMNLNSLSIYIFCFVYGIVIIKQESYIALSKLSSFYVVSLDELAVYCRTWQDI